MKIGNFSSQPGSGQMDPPCAIGKWFPGNNPLDTKDGGGGEVYYEVRKLKSPMMDGGSAFVMRSSAHLQSADNP